MCVCVCCLQFWSWFCFVWLFLFRVRFFTGETDLKVVVWYFGRFDATAPVHYRDGPGRSGSRAGAFSVADSTALNALVVPSV